MNLILIFCAKYLYLLVMLGAIVYIFTQPKNKQKDIITLVVISFPLTYLAAKIAAHFYFDPRPFVVGHFTPLIAHAPDNGFPSDHTLLTSAIASAIFFYNKKMSAYLLVLAILVGLARVLSGVHHLVDIIGAIVISILVISITDYILKRQRVILYRN